eukprot:scaffold145502_cov78-Attheya_sp.AAC.2
MNLPINHQLSNQQPDPNHSSFSLFNTVLKIITIANQDLLSTCCVITSTFHRSISCPAEPPLILVCIATAPHPNIGHMPLPPVDAGWTSDSFTRTAPTSALTLNTPASSHHYCPITVR